LPEPRDRAAGRRRDAMEHRWPPDRRARPAAGVAAGAPGAGALRRDAAGGSGPPLRAGGGVSRRAQPAGRGRERGGPGADPQRADPLLRAADVDTEPELTGARGAPPNDATDERLAQEIVDNLNTGAIVVDRNLLVAALNPAAEDLLGVSRHRACGKPLLELAGDHRQLGELVRRALTTGLTFADELELAPTEVHPAPRLVDCRVSPMQGELTRDCLLVEMIDVTRRSRISRENALIVQHGAGRQMIRQLAHEIKNPLGGLRGAAQL